MNCFSVGYKGELTVAAIQFHAFQALKKAKTQLKRNTGVQDYIFYKILIIKL